VTVVLKPVILIHCHFEINGSFLSRFVCTVFEGILKQNTINGNDQKCMEKPLK